MKKQICMIAVTTLASLMLAGCFDEETRTVEYYESHPQEHQAKIDECANNPGELMQTPNCKNAMQAQANKITGRNKDKSKWNQ